MPTKKLLLLLLLAGLAIGGTVGYMMWNKPHEDLSSATPDFVLDAQALFSDFETDEASANEKYLGKLVEVKGTVQEITETSDGGVSIILKGEMDMFGVNCAFLQHQDFEVGSEITVRGQCSGYLMDVALARCVTAP